MWTFMILIFLILQSTRSDLSKDECERIPTDYCKQTDNDPVPVFNIPFNENELNTYCRRYLSYIKCLEDYEDSCPFGYMSMFHRPFDFQMNVRLVKEICNRDSKLHIEYTNHMFCIKLAIEAKYNDCKNESKTVAYKYYEFLSERMENGELDMQSLREEYFALPPCLEATYADICILSQIEETCSKEAAMVSREIIERSSFPLRSCFVKDFINLGTGFLKFLSDSDESAYLRAILSSPELVEFVNNPRHAHTK